MRGSQARVTAQGAWPRRHRQLLQGARQRLPTRSPPPPSPPAAARALAKRRLMLRCRGAAPDGFRDLLLAAAAAAKAQPPGQQAQPQAGSAAAAARVDPVVLQAIVDMVGDWGGCQQGAGLLQRLCSSLQAASRGAIAALARTALQLLRQQRPSGCRAPRAEAATTTPRQIG